MFRLLLMCVCLCVCVCVCLCVTDHILQAVNGTGDLAFFPYGYYRSPVTLPFSINCKTHVTLSKIGKNKVVVVVVAEINTT